MHRAQNAQLWLVFYAVRGSACEAASCASRAGIPVSKLAVTNNRR
jgi:hypothetical protein